MFVRSSKEVWCEKLATQSAVHSTLWVVQEK